MKFAINLNAILAVRAEANYCSEMTSQLLFGEYCSILDQKDGFYRVENYFEKHIGWVAYDGLIEISEEEAEKLIQGPIIRICVPMAEVFWKNSKSIIRLPMGSLVVNYDPDYSEFGIAGMKYQIHPSFISYLPESNVDGIIPTAMSLLNTPYLNGGKTMFGMDCSGFAQTVFETNGYMIPRFSLEQSNTGETVSSIEEAVQGDLLFFTKEGVPSHTGVYIGDNKMIHAANYIKIEEMEKGANDVKIRQSDYKLYKIKRIA